MFVEKLDKFLECFAVTAFFFPPLISIFFSSFGLHKRTYKLLQKHLPQIFRGAARAGAKRANEFRRENQRDVDGFIKIRKKGREAPRVFFRVGIRREWRCE